MEALRSGVNVFSVMTPENIRRTAERIEVQLIAREILRAGSKRSPRLRKLP